MSDQEKPQSGTVGPIKADPIEGEDLRASQIARLRKTKEGAIQEEETEED